MIEIREEAVGDLSEHAAIPSTFETGIVHDVRHAAAGIELAGRKLDTLFRKDYDQFEDPRTWPRDFDTRNWVLLSAFDGEQRVAGLLVAHDTPGVDMLEARADLAVLWDLRVRATHRRQGVATSLLAAARAWAVQHGCTEVKVETQNTNPAACSFYLRSGFTLAQATAHAYALLPDEVQLIFRWRLDGASPPIGGCRLP